VEKLGLAGKKVLGFSGEARAKKGLSTMLLATKELAIRHPVCLMLLGGVRSGDDAHLVDVFTKQNPDIYVHSKNLFGSEALKDCILRINQRAGYVEIEQKQ